MSVANVAVLIKQVIEPPPVTTPLDVKNSRGAVIGKVLLSESVLLTSWLTRLAAFTTENIVSATVNFGTVNANNFKSEVIDTNPLNVNAPANTFITVINPQTAGGLILWARMVLTGRIQVYCYNYTAVNITPGDLACQFWVQERK